MAPASLSLLTVTFTEPKERARAFGVYGAVAGGGAAIGLVLGGLLTQYASWRWTLLINVPIAIVTAVATVREVKESRAEGEVHYDIPGALTVTLGLLSLVYGFTRAETDGWGSSTTLLLLAAAVVLLVAFVIIERSTAAPLLPLRVILDRNRGGSFLASLLVGLSLFGMFLFLTFYLQGTLHYSALKSGFAFLPFSAGIIISAMLASQALPRVGPRLLMTGGLVMAVLGMLWFTQIGLHTSYVAHVLPAEIVMSMGMGFVFVPFSSSALIGVAPQDAGVASALVNATQQVGGQWAQRCSIPCSPRRRPAIWPPTRALAKVLAPVHGYTTGFEIGSVVLCIAVVSTILLIKASGRDLPATEHVGAIA